MPLRSCPCLSSKVSYMLMSIWQKRGCWGEPLIIDTSVEEWRSSLTRGRLVFLSFLPPFPCQAKRWWNASEMLSVQSNVWMKPQFMIKKTVQMEFRSVQLQRKRTFLENFQTIILFTVFQLLGFVLYCTITEQSECRLFCLICPVKISENHLKLIHLLCCIRY